jgi:glycosyltransferase involved in cell wall biosynthesis
VKVLFLANTEWYLYNFRLALARALRAAGAEVVMASPFGAYGARLEAEGFRWVSVPMDRRSLNPMRELRLLSDFVALYRREAPDVVHHFTIKCVVYGSLAARLASIPRRINAVAGMGHVFSSNHRRSALLRPFVRQLLRIALSGKESRLILQNPDDAAAFREARLIDDARIRLIRGSGVNTERFRPLSGRRRASLPFRVLFGARLLWDKGVGEYIEAARLLKGAGLDIEFVLAGAPDAGNPAAVPAATVSAWQAAAVVTVLGHVDDILPWLHQVDVVALPSYYGEGVPRGLIEAAATGLPIITTDFAGCREIVDHGGNGLLVPCRDARALAEAIRYLHDKPAERERMGAAGREKVLNEFDERIVIAKTLEVYRELAPDMFGAPGVDTLESAL